MISKFKLYEKLKDSEKKQQLAADICNLLTVHCICEEELLYPMVHQVVDKLTIYVAEIEHSCVMKLVDTIIESSPDDDERDALVKVLSGYTLAHIKQEEAVLFPKLKGATVDLKRVGVAMLELKLKMMERFRTIRQFEMLELDLPVAKMN